MFLIATLLCAGASASEIRSIDSLNEELLCNGLLRVGFDLSQLTDKAVTADIYQEIVFEGEAVKKLAVGDAIRFGDTVISIENIDTEYSIFINGSEAEGYELILTPCEDGLYHAYEYESPLFEKITSKEYPLADEICFSRWQEDEEGSIMDELLQIIVPAAELKQAILDFNEYAEALYPAEAQIQIADGVVTGLTINFTP